MKSCSVKLLYYHYSPTAIFLCYLSRHLDDFVYAPMTERDEQNEMSRKNDAKLLLCWTIKMTSQMKTTNGKSEKNVNMDEKDILILICMESSCISLFSYQHCHNTFGIAFIHRKLFKKPHIHSLLNIV